ncbi:hypothetical protein AXF42_Ash009796 [Apostasia shenzhenica]|uniref:OTU domain-containing protein n=1 Tax=Apostasia shenzhenica TaxID=1088818 RepID=A0A2I0AX39_9ASPA|nr:hypothetical protein AXF42_Ash009796 [Apostasia shenzhenica]
MHVHGYHDDGARANRTSQVVEILDGMDPQMREHMIDRFFDMTDPSQSTVRAPSYKTEHRGRPTGKDEQSRRRIPSFTNLITSGSKVTQTNAMSRRRGRGRGSGVRNTQSTYDHSPIPPIRDTYIEQLPVVIQRHISHTVDVKPGGHCGFRAIAALIGYGEECWFQVRYELMEEIQQNKRQYDQLYSVREMADNLLFLLNNFEQPAPERHWMECMTLGIVIASRYNLVLHTFGQNNWNCFTHLPLRSPPVPDQERREIAIAHVGRHFVQVFLHPHYPVPPFPTWWWNHSSDEAKGWAARYITRVNLWYEITGTGANGPGAKFGGNID